MHIAEFSLERFFARWEFACKYLLCASDVEPLTLAELLEIADQETRELWRSLSLGYTESAGHPLLRREIASTYDSVREDHVLTFAGAQEAIFLVVHAAVGAGDHVVVAWPAYQSLFEVARSIGAQVTLVPLDPSDWSLDPERVIAELRPNTRLVVVNFPHSPTGALLSQEAFTCLVHGVSRHGVHLLCDEVYRGLELDPGIRLPAGVDSTLSEHAISLGVMSKAYGLAGLRIGWIATRDSALLGRVGALKDYTTICSSAPSEILALMALRAREHLLARSRGILSANLGVLDAFFERSGSHFQWVRPRAGSVGFPRLLTGDVDRFADDLVRTEGVLVLPGSLFGYGGNHFRLGFGRRNMAEGLERLEAFALSRSAR